MFLKKWFEKRAKEKADKHIEEKWRLKKIVEMGGIEKYKGVFDVSEQFKLLFDKIKDDYAAPKVENFNTNLQEILYRISVDSQLRESVSTYIPEGSSFSFLHLLVKNEKLMNKENMEILFSIINYNAWLKINENKNEENEISLLSYLLFINPGALLLLIENNSGVKNHLFDRDVFWVANSEVSINTTLELSSIIKKWVELNNTSSLKKKEEKKKEQLLNLIITLVKIAEFPENPTSEERKFIDVLFESVCYLPFSVISEFIENNKNKKILLGLIPKILENFEKEQKTDTNENDIKLIKRIFEINNYTFKEMADSNLIYASDKLLTEKTYKMWIENFTDETSKEKEILKIANCNMLLGNLKNFSYFLTEYSFNEESNRELHQQFFDSLSTPVFMPYFLKNIELFLEYFHDKVNYNLNRKREDSENGYGFIEECVVNNAMFDVEKIKTLKDYGLDPFLKNEKNKSIYELANSETKNAIATVYFQEMAKFEKEILMNSISTNENNNIILSKKRL